jgi:uncharacterized protein YuzE
MKIKYDKETDVLYIKFLDAIISESEDMNGIIFDYDELEKIVGIEVLKASTKFPDVNKVEYE